MSANTIFVNVKDAIQFMTPLSGLTNIPHYMIAGRSYPWPSDSSPPAVDSSPGSTDYRAFEDMIFAKLVTSNDTSLMINRYDWISGTVYAYYDSSDPALLSKNFFVVNYESGNYNVFKCLGNNGGIPSAYPPLLSQTTSSDFSYRTADGYHWKYMFTIPVSVYTKFATSQYIPVVANTSVQLAAANGAINSIVVNNGGLYYSYTQGTFDAIAVSGNSQVFALTSSDLLLSIQNTSGSFVQGEYVTQANTNASGLLRFANSSTLTLSSVSGQFIANASVTGITSNAVTSVLSTQSTQVSSNNNFYTGCSLYISQGTGAGQVRDIVGYQVSGTQRLVTVNTAFTVLPDFTSYYEIAPKVKIQGDGTGAIAVSKINTATYAIQGVYVVNSGINFTQANVSFVGNTGSFSLANSAVATAMIAPKGGHGSNPISELGANKVGISVDFPYTQTNIPPNGSYRRLGLLADPHIANVSLSIANTVGAFSIGETVVQSVPQIYSMTTYTSPTLLANNVWTASKYTRLSLSSSIPLPLNAPVTSNTGGTGVVTSVLSGSSYVIRTDTGAFANGSQILLSSNNAVNATITAVTSGLTNSVYGLNDANTLFTFDNTSQWLKVSVGSNQIYSSNVVGSNAVSFTANSTAITFNNLTLSNTSVVTVNFYQANVQVQTLVNNGSLTSGTVVASNSSVVQLSNVRGLFSNAYGLTGLSSAATANVATVTGQNTDFDNRTWITCTYTAGSANVVANDLLYQYDTANNVLATARVYDVSTISGNTMNVTLTAVNGTVNPTANGTNKYLQSADGTKSILISSVTKNSFVPYTGNFEYLENIVPVTRGANGANTADTVRLVLSFS